MSNKILIVEDNVLNIKYLGLLMKKWNLDYDIAYNGLEAIAKTIENEYSIIFMDIQMPIKNGFEATMVIRNHDNINHNTPIYAISADSVKEQMIKALEIGMNGFLSKPFIPSDIQNILNEHKIAV